MQSGTPSIKLIKFLPAIVWFLLVLVLICLPGDDIPDAGWLSIVDFDKIVHGGLFGGMVFLFCLPYKNATFEKSAKQHIFIKITIAAIIWGLTTELIQKYFIPGRQYDLLDWAADSFGAILSFFVCRKLFL
jgi:hypothetical protein